MRLLENPGVMVPNFDWYQATVRAPVDDVVGALLVGSSSRLRHAKGMHGYATTTHLEDIDGTWCKVQHGGSHEYPNLILSGHAAREGSKVIRAAFPQHSVTRVDVCEDYGDADAFDRMLPALLASAKRHRVRLDTRGDHLLHKVGRTVYLGSEKSAVRLRQYDKAAELRAKYARDPVALAEVPSHLTRLEAQVRPAHKEAKQAFASIEPEQVMGSSPWLHQVWQAVSGADLERVHVGKPWRQADDDRAYAAMLWQYAGLLEKVAETAGSWECVGLQLRDDIKAQRAARSKRKGGST